MIPSNYIRNILNILYSNKKAMIRNTITYSSIGYLT